MKLPEAQTETHFCIFGDKYSRPVILFVLANLGIAMLLCLFTQNIFVYILSGILGAISWWLIFMVHPSTQDAHDIIVFGEKGDERLYLQDSLDELFKNNRL